MLYCHMELPIHEVTQPLFEERLLILALCIHPVPGSLGSLIAGIDGGTHVRHSGRMNKSESMTTYNFSSSGSFSVSKERHRDMNFWRMDLFLQILPGEETSKRARAQTRSVLHLTVDRFFQLHLEQEIQDDEKIVIVGSLPEVGLWK